jgi:ribonuclease Z
LAASVQARPIGDEFMAEQPLPIPAHLGGTQALTTTPVVGAPAQQTPDTYVPGAEELAPGEIRVTVLGSGDPWVRRSQASGSLLIEVGNPEKDFFFFLDLGSGSLANFTALGLPVESTTKLFLSHLHADHVGDVPGLLGSFAKAGRVDPVEIWGGGSDDPAMGLATFVEHMSKAMAWDTASIRGARPTTGCKAIAHEIAFDRPAAVYEANGVAISSFPAIHALSGAVGYLTVFNVTEEAVTARQATVNDAAPPVHGPSRTSPEVDPPVPPPAWWSEALLDV